MEGRVKVAIHVLSEMYKASESWMKFSSEAFFKKDRGVALRRALMRKTEGIVFHDRILSGRKI